MTKQDEKGVPFMRVTDDLRVDRKFQTYVIQ